MRVRMKIGMQAMGSEGDIQPFHALAAGLVKAGHEVTLAVDDLSRDYSPLARRFGYRLVVVEPSGARPAKPSEKEAEKFWVHTFHLGDPVRQYEACMRHFDQAEPLYAAAKELCASNDLVVGHYFAFPLRVAAEKSGVPIATLNMSGYWMPSPRIHPPYLSRLGRLSYRLGWRLGRAKLNRIFLPHVNALRLREGLRPDDDVLTQTWAAEKLNLIAVSRHMFQRPADWGERHQVCGFLSLPADPETDHLPEGLDEFLAQGGPPVYLTFGSMMLNSMDYVRETAAVWMEAVRGVGCRAILQLPRKSLPGSHRDDQIFLVERAPYRRVFPRCSMVVHHGGSGTTQSAMLAGRPSLIVAHLFDQFFWGAQLERLGVAGKMMKRSGMKAKQLSAGIAGVLADGGIAQRAQQMGTLMAQEDGVRTAIALIEARLSR
jgi:UDP:flavonoid glycosyltransferase YjiC (YdhE family)